MALFSHIWAALHGQDKADKPVETPQGRQGLLSAIGQAQTVTQAMAHVLTLLEDSGFCKSFPAGDVLLCEHQAKRPWSAAVEEWREHGGGEAEVILSCDRKLVLRYDGQ